MSEVCVRAVMLMSRIFIEIQILFYLVRGQEITCIILSLFVFTIDFFMNSQRNAFFPFFFFFLLLFLLIIFLLYFLGVQLSSGKTEIRIEPNRIGWFGSASKKFGTVFGSKLSNRNRFSSISVQEFGLTEPNRIEIDFLSFTIPSPYSVLGILGLLSLFSLNLRDSQV